MSTQDRSDELEELSVHVYQQLQAGCLANAIRPQLENYVTLSADETDYVIKRARERYDGYYDLYRASDRDTAKWLVWGGILLIGVIYLAISTLGLPVHGRGRGIATTGMLLGGGAIAYGVWIWLKAGLTGRRSDLDEL